MHHQHFLRYLLLLTLPYFYDCRSYESETFSQVRRLSGQAYGEVHNIPINHSSAVTSFPHKPLFRWDASEIVLNETTTQKPTKGIKSHKKKKKGPNKRKRKDKTNVWWPWANYEEWLANHKRGSVVKTGDKKGNDTAVPQQPHKNGKNKRKRNGKNNHRRNNKDKEMNNETVNDREAPKRKKGRPKVRAHRMKEEMQKMPPMTEPPPPGVLYLTAPKQPEEENEIRHFQEWMPSWKNSLSKVTKRNFTSDKNECLHNNGGCEGLCVNTPGSYYCHCPQGFKLDTSRTKCLDVNECLVRNGHGPCQGECRNRWGGYECGCASVPGTELAPDRKSCRARDSCATANCSHICINTRSGPFCACPQGYVLGQDWKSCQDVDECLQPELQEPKCDGHCINTVGSFICS